MQLTDCITDYLRFIRHERGLSENTHRGYQAQLRHFTRWLVENGHPQPTTDCLTVPLCRRFLYYLSGKGLRPRTVRSYFDPLGGMCLFLIENGLLTENPVKALTLPQKDAALRQTVSNEEIAGLLEACCRYRVPKVTALNSAVLHLLIFSGARRSELCDLHLADIDFAEKSLLIRAGKGQKSRKVYLPKNALDAVREYLPFRPKDCHKPYLIMMDRARRLWHRSLHTLLEDVKATAGYAGRENIKPHSLRHWRATDLMRAGADLKSVSAFLGHNQLATTSIYLHTDEEQCRSIAELSTLGSSGKAQENDGKIIDLRERQQQAAKGERSRRDLRRQA